MAAACQNTINGQKWKALIVGNKIILHWQNHKSNQAINILDLEKIMQSLRFKKYLVFLILLFSYNSFAESVKQMIDGNAGSKLFAESFGKFNEPWAMTFLPNGNLLVTEKSGTLKLINMSDRSMASVKSIPKVAYGGQGGFGDVIIHPQYKDNQWIYLSYIEEDNSGKKGAVVVRARFLPTLNRLELENIEVIWKQSPKVSGSGHYSHRLAFSPDGIYSLLPVIGKK